MEMEASGNVQCSVEDSEGGHNLEPGVCGQVVIRARGGQSGVKWLFGIASEQQVAMTGYASQETLIDSSFSRGGEQSSQIVLMNLVLTVSLIISSKNQ